MISRSVPGSHCAGYQGCGIGSCRAGATAHAGGCQLARSRRGSASQTTASGGCAFAQPGHPQVGVQPGEPAPMATGAGTPARPGRDLADHPAARPRSVPARRVTPASAAAAASWPALLPRPGTTVLRGRQGAGAPQPVTRDTDKVGVRAVPCRASAAQRGSKPSVLDGIHAGWTAADAAGRRAGMHRHPPPAACTAATTCRRTSTGSTASPGLPVGDDLAQPVRAACAAASPGSSPSPVPAPALENWPC